MTMASSPPANELETTLRASSSSNDDPTDTAGKSKTDDDDEDVVVGTVFAAARRGTLVTIALRLLSFVATQWTLRRLATDPTVLGQTAVRLELISTTVLFVSREGFRLALTTTRTTTTRSSNDDDDVVVDDNWNVAWLSVPVVTIVSTMALIWHVVTSTDSSSSSPDYLTGGCLYCLAACIEGWGEPAVLYALRRSDATLRVSAETAASLIKTFATVVLLSYCAPVTATGAAQVVYGCVYTGFVVTRTWGQLPAPTWSWSSWDMATCRLTLMFTLQGLLKHFLTEGDRLVLTAFSDGYQQGVYAMGAAYGGLAARLLLQPLEENARLLWSRLATTKPMTEQSSSTSSTTTTQQQQQYRLLGDSYTVLVKVVLYLGLLFSCVAVHYTGLLLHALAGRAWADHPQAITVLSAFCVYTAFLAANGMTEAFVYAVTSTAVDVGRAGAVHAVVGVVFALTAVTVVPRYGTTGLVATNCLAMALRTTYAVHFAARYFSRRRRQQPAPTEEGDVVVVVWRRLLQRATPPAAVWLAFGMSWAVTRTSLRHFQHTTTGITPGSLLWWRGAVAHVGVGVASVVGTLSLAFVLETSFRRTALALYKGRKLD